MPLKLSWVQRTDLGTLTGAEVHGAPMSLSGDALLSGFYVNELLLHFLHRHDPQPEIFDSYEHTVSALVGSGDVALQLRDFEVELLRQLGYAPNLEYEAGSQQPIDAQQHYEYHVEQGPVAVKSTEGPMVFTGATLTAIGERRFAEPDVLRAANRLLREIIAFHLGGKELKSRKVLVDLHRVGMSPPGAEGS